MPSSAAEWLQGLGVAQLVDSADALSQSYASTWAVSRGLRRSAVPEMLGLVELGAIEFALSPYFLHFPVPDGTAFQLSNILATPLSFPIAVGPLFVLPSIFKTDCGPFIEHSRKAPEDIKPWDVFLFAGDMSKAEIWELSDLLPDYGAVSRLTSRLANSYEAVGLGPSIVDSGLLVAQGLVWASRLALLRNEPVEVVAEATDLVTQFNSRAGGEGRDRLEY